MRRSEAMAALAADPRLGILVDRRRLDRVGAIPTDLMVVEELNLPAGRPGVRAALVTAADGGDLPQRDPHSPHAQVRLMDRFYIPRVADEAVIGPMFNLIAGSYDAFINRSLNLATTARLLRTACADTGILPTILDFGCGTGLAADALATLQKPARLLGVDASAAMLARAGKRGMATMSLAAWRRHPPMVDGAIASFVLHYGVASADLFNLAGSLRPGARFAANLFGPEPGQLDCMVDLLGQVGLRLEGTTEISGSRKANLLLSFRRPS